MTLDVVLGHRDRTFLATEREKVAYFTEQCGVPIEALPHRDYRARDPRGPVTTRYFVDRTPICLTPPSSDPSFVYLGCGESTEAGLETFLTEYACLFRHLSTVRVVYVVGRHDPTGVLPDRFRRAWEGAAAGASCVGRSRVDRGAPETLPCTSALGSTAVEGVVAKRIWIACGRTSAGSPAQRTTRCTGVGVRRATPPCRPSDGSWIRLLAGLEPAFDVWHLPHRYVITGHRRSPMPVDIGLDIDPGSALLPRCLSIQLGRHRAPSSQVSRRRVFPSRRRSSAARAPTDAWMGAREGATPCLGGLIRPSRANGRLMFGGRSLPRPMRQASDSCLPNPRSCAAAASQVSASRKDIPMPLIAPQLKHAREAINVRLDVRILALLKAYAEFIESSQEYVLNQFLVVAFAQDRDFQGWLATTHPDEAAHLEDLAGERRAGGSHTARRSRVVRHGGVTANPTSASANRAATPQTQRHRGEGAHGTPTDDRTAVRPRGGDHRHHRRHGVPPVAVPGG